VYRYAAPARKRCWNMPYHHQITMAPVNKRRAAARVLNSRYHGRDGGGDGISGPAPGREAWLSVPGQTNPSRRSGSGLGVARLTGTKIRAERRSMTPATQLSTIQLWVTDQKYRRRQVDQIRTPQWR